MSYQSVYKTSNTISGCCTFV